VPAAGAGWERRAERYTRKVNVINHTKKSREEPSERARSMAVFMAIPVESGSKRWRVDQVPAGRCG
jgi:hypothetical protein